MGHSPSRLTPTAPSVRGPRIAAFGGRNAVLCVPNNEIRRAGGIAPADQVTIIARAKEKYQPPKTTVIARGKAPWQSPGGMLRKLRFEGKNCTPLPPSFMRGAVQAQRRTGGSMRYMVTFTVTFRRIRTAAGLPPPFGHPPHKCGGQGDGAYLWRFPYRFCVSGDCHAALRLAMTVMVEGWGGFALVHSVTKVVLRDGTQAVPYGCGAYIKRAALASRPCGVRDYLAQRNRKVTT